MAYIISHTTNPLEAKDLHAGLVVCFEDVATNPNNIGILEKPNGGSANNIWKATINNVLYHFDKDGYELNDRTKRLYGIVSPEITVGESSVITRAGGDVATISGLIAKDQFALAAMQSLIQSMPDPISIDDGTITALATKAYKISQAMLVVAATARSADEEQGSSGDTVPVTSDQLANTSEKLLNNISVGLGNITAKLNEIKNQDAAKFTTGIKVDNPTNDSFNVEGQGSGSSIDAQTLKEICENNLNWGTLPTNDLVSIVGFSLKNNNRIPSETSITNLLTLLEAQQAIGSNSSALYWIRKFQETVIDSIATFLEAYGQDIWNHVSPSVDSRIEAKVKAEALKS